MIIWISWSKNDLKVSHRKQVKYPSNMNLAIFLTSFECQTCAIFEGFSYHQEDEDVDPIIFAANVGSGDIINQLVSSHFMGMVSSVSVIFDTGATYSCSYDKGEFLKIEEKMSQRNIKVIAKRFEISGFGIVEYSIRNETGRIIVLRDQSYYAPGLQNDFPIT